MEEIDSLLLGLSHNSSSLLQVKEPLVVEPARVAPLPDLRPKETGKQRLKININQYEDQRDL